MTVIHSVIEGEHRVIGIAHSGQRHHIADVLKGTSMNECGFSADCDVSWAGDHYEVRNPESGRLYGTVGVCDGRP